MNLRYTIILILVAAALGIFAWTQRATEPVDVSKGAPTATPVALLDLKPEDVQEVEVSGADGTYTLTRVAGGWEVDGEKTSDQVDGVVANLAKPAVLRELPADRKPEDYGFDSLSLTVTLKTAGGESQVIEVGDDTQVDPNVYIRLKDGTRIVIVSNTDVTSLKDWFINRPLAPTATPPGAGDSAVPGDAGGLPPIPGFPTVDPAAMGTPLAVETVMPDETVMPEETGVPVETVMPADTVTPAATATSSGG
jgi:hypothetical protein